MPTGLELCPPLTPEFLSLTSSASIDKRRLLLPGYTNLVDFLGRGRRNTNFEKPPLPLEASFFLLLTTYFLPKGTLPSYTGNWNQKTYDSRSFYQLHQEEEEEEQMDGACGCYNLGRRLPDADDEPEEPACFPSTLSYGFREASLVSLGSSWANSLMDGIIEEEENPPPLLEDLFAPQSLLTSKISYDGHNVMTYSIMVALQRHLPIAKQGESFWLQYSMIRDGASIETLLDKVQDHPYSVLAIETMDGEIFGAFCGQPWKISHDYYGSRQTFLWRFQRSVGEQGVPLNESSSSLSTDSFGSTDAEDGLDVFKFAFANENIQLCENGRIVIGGGTKKNDYKWGFGLALDQDLMQGSSSPCLTFDSPSLSTKHEDGSFFEIRNLEVWALTPCLSVEAAENNQRKKSGSFSRRRGAGIVSALRRRSSRRKPIKGG